MGRPLPPAALIAHRGIRGEVYKNAGGKPARAEMGTPNRKVCVDGLLMHPLMAEITPNSHSWKSNVQVRDHDRYTIGVNRGRMQRFMQRSALDWELISSTVWAWLDRHELRVCERRRALLDLRLKRFWYVDFVCETTRDAGDGECCLVCLFHGGRKEFAVHEIKYADRLRRLGRQTYGANVRVLCVKVWGRGWQNASTWESGAEAEVSTGGIAGMSVI